MSSFSLSFIHFRWQPRMSPCIRTCCFPGKTSFLLGRLLCSVLELVSWHSRRS